MSQNKEYIFKLSTIISDYASPEKSKREESERQLKDLRNNLGMLSLALLEISISNDFSEQIKLTSLVLLRKIIELDSKNQWGSIDPHFKEKIKLTSLNIIFNDNISNNRSLINNAISVVEQILVTIIDFNEDWNELFQLSNNLYNLNFPNDIIKIYSYIKLLKVCISFLSDKLIGEINKLNNYFLKIFQTNITNNNQNNNNNNIEKILELKVIICGFYSELLTYNILDIGNIAMNSFAINNMMNTLNDCIFFLKNGNILKIDNLTSDLLDSMDFLTSMNILDSFPENQIQLCQLYYSIIELNNDNLQKVKEQCFQKILDIFLLKTLPNEELESALKKYLDSLFLYGFKELNTHFNEENEDFSNISGNYTEYEKVPKIFYDFLNFMLEITSKIIEEDEKKIIKELSISLINNNNIIYKYTGLMLFPQVIESCNKFSEIESLVPTILNNINNQNNQIRYAASYCLSYLVYHYKNHFIKKYSEQFLTVLINSIKKETCIHSKCEMISLFNSYLSQLDDDIDDEANNDTDDEDELEENQNQNIIDNNINVNNINMTAKEYINQNCKEIFEFLFNLFEDSLNKGKDNECSLVKEVLLNTILTCISYYGIKCKPYAIKSIEFLGKYLDSIYTKRIKDNLYMGLLNTISSFGKYEEDYIAKLLPSLFKCLEEILNKIRKNTPNLNHIQDTLTNLLPIIINKNNELIPIFIKDILELIEYALNQGDESNINYLEDINSILKALSSSIEILEDKCLNYITTIENTIFKINNKYKSNSDIHITSSNILYNFLKIISEEKNSDKNALKKLGKNYLDISFKMIKNESKPTTSVILTEDLNKMMEIIISYMDQSELEQLFKGVIELIELFEGKRLHLIRKKNKKENEKEEKEENKKEEDDTLSSLDDYDEEKNAITFLANDIQSLEQVIENFSLIIENMLKYGNKLSLNNIYDALYNKIIPSLISSVDNIPLLKKYQNNLKIAANLIDDIFEYSDLNSLNPNYIDKLIVTLINLTTNQKANIRQSATYGLGIFIKLADSNNIYSKYSKNILLALKSSYELFFNNINKEETMKREDGLAYDNIIASLGKAVGYKNLEDKIYINLWIENLPIKYDETEMIEGHNILCEFVLSNRHISYNLDEEDCCKIIKIFIYIYKEKDLSNTDINKKIKEIFKNKSELNPLIENIYNQYKIQQKNKNVKKYIDKIEEIKK